MLSFDFYQLNTICRVHTPEVRIVGRRPMGIHYYWAYFRSHFAKSRTAQRHTALAGWGTSRSNIHFTPAPGLVTWPCITEVSKFCRQKVKWGFAYFYWLSPDLLKCLRCCLRYHKRSFGKRNVRLNYLLCFHFAGVCNIYGDSNITSLRDGTGRQFGLTIFKCCIGQPV